jgi:release factor glutamine methyltransferase
VLQVRKNQVRENPAVSDADFMQHSRRVVLVKLKACMESPLEARLLLQAACAITKEQLIMDDQLLLTSNEAQTLVGFVNRYQAHEPIARILGKREFWGLDFCLNSATLVPRPETEHLIEAVLAARTKDLPSKNSPLRILDLGTGSGCILISLLTEFKQATGVGVDLSADALACAAQNAQAHQVSQRSVWQQGSWYQALESLLESAQKFDIIISNPPYICSDVIPQLAKNVQDFDPYLALDGGESGLEAYEIIIAQAAQHLKPQGLLVVEIGFDQEDAVTHLMQTYGFMQVRCIADLAGHPRVILGESA